MLFNIPPDEIRRLLPPDCLVTHVYPENGPFTHFKVDGIIQTREQCIDAIEKQGKNYWTRPSDYPKIPGAWIGVRRSKKTKLPYLRTDDNDTEADNLGTLPLIQNLEIHRFPMK